MSPGMIVASILVAFLGVFFLYVYYRFLSGYADRRARLKRRQARTRRARFSRHCREQRRHDKRRDEDDVELGLVPPVGPVGTKGVVARGNSEMIRRDPKVVRKPVRAEVEFFRGDRGRGFVDVPLVDEEEGMGVVVSSSLGQGLGKREEGVDVPGGVAVYDDRVGDSGYEISSSKSERHSINSNAGQCVPSSSSSHTSTPQQQQFPSRRAARRSERRRCLTKVNVVDAEQLSDPRLEQEPPASSLPPSVHEVSHSSSSLPVVPYLQPSPSAAAAPKLLENRASKSSCWSPCRTMQDGFGQVQARGVLSPSSTSFFAAQDSNSHRSLQPPPLALVRPASSVHPASELGMSMQMGEERWTGMKTYESGHQTQHLPALGAARTSTVAENPFDDLHQISPKGEDDDDWTSRVASTVFTRQGSCSSSSFFSSVHGVEKTRGSRVLSRMGHSIEEVLDKLGSGVGSWGNHCDRLEMPPVPAIPAMFLGGGSSGCTEEVASAAGSSKTAQTQREDVSKGEANDGQECFGQWVRRGMAMSECDSP